jgi:hypothetical protein
MQEVGSKTEFESQVRNWRLGRSPVAMRDVSVWEHRVTSGLQRLPYLLQTSRMRTENPDLDVLIQAKLKSVGGNFDSVKKDFGTIWRSIVLGDRKSLVCFVPNGNGFDLHFAALDEEDCYFVGCVQANLPIAS